MRPWLELSIPEFRSTPVRVIAERLSFNQTAQRLAGEPAQLHAWEVQAGLLHHALADAGWDDARIAFEYDMLRLEHRIDAVVVTPRGIFVLEFKVGARSATSVDLRQVQDYAQNLRDFHAASRAHPILPLLVVTEARRLRPLQVPMMIGGVTPVVEANASELSGRMASLRNALPVTAIPLSPAAWMVARYRPVPTIVEAAARLYARNSVAEIAAARADTANLNATTVAILAALDDARRKGDKVVVFVTGVPGAGKTLCGLNIVFGESRREGTAFLTGNTPLVAVLREALALNRAGVNLGAGPSNDPWSRKRQVKLRLDDARAQTKQALQNVHNFLADNAHGTSPPADRIIVFDEAQRAWNAAQAILKTKTRPTKLTLSEPAHALAIMGRHEGFAAIVALIGNGQEINTGEAGLREWGEVIGATPGWRAVAAGRTVTAQEPRQRLADGPAPWLTLDDALDLTVPLRGVRTEAGAAWVDAVLRGAAAEAAEIAAGVADFPYFVTRSLPAARDALRRFTPGLRRAGFVRSSGAKRLRGEGFDAQLIGTEEPVAWFLERWPDIRASDALETAATEYACQGLELDAVGLAWGGDMLWERGRWFPRSFAGRGWNRVSNAADAEFIRNTYRVLLTRARYETVIWVPPGSPADDPFHDATRPARDMDAIADFLRACGARALTPAPVMAPAATLL